MANISQRSETRVALWQDMLAGSLLAAISLGFWSFALPYQRLNAQHPYIVGFCIFALLSTFGEAISLRLAARRWLPDHLMRRATLWGLLGVWISAVFPFQAGGVDALIGAGLWPHIPVAFTVSLWANLLSGFGFFMMVTHFWAEKLLTHRPMPPWAIFADPGFVPWAKIVMLSLVLFWLPAHTLTFLLPVTLRTLVAAYLGIALGIILTAGKDPRA